MTIEPSMIHAYNFINNKNKKAFATSLKKYFSFLDRKNAYEAHEAFNFLQII